MHFWEEEESTHEEVVNAPVVDLSFRMECRALPLDHADALARAVEALLPWFAGEPEAGMHAIHGAESGNGWYRPDGSGDELLYLSRRTRFTLRVPEHRVEEARALSGQELDVTGYPLRLGEATERPLEPSATLFARYVIGGEEEGEAEFLARAAAALRELGIVCKKMLCGRSNTIRTADGVLHARSLMLADLKPADSLRLQQVGLGAGRKLGCGLFIPHKSIKKVSEHID